ncbi:hypothetical protein OF83DRAFT_109864 [Amylostereum chailletii]|nr:hypothetical protein OF83DRAFT_109864 [Amylostereum chailletii]
MCWSQCVPYNCPSNSVQPQQFLYLYLYHPLPHRALIMFEIEWNGENPRRKASTIHGWLCKMRGTIMGNEAVRRRGRYEMKRAKANRRAGHKVQRRGSLFSLFRGVGNRKRGSSSRSKPSASGARRHPHSSTRQRDGVRSKSISSKPAPVRRSTTRPSEHRPKPPVRRSTEPARRDTRGGGRSNRHPEPSRRSSQPNPSRHDTLRKSSGRR